MSLLSTLQHSPDATLIVGTLGVLLIYLELNRPGTIVPGAGGLLLVLLTASVLMRMPLAWTGLSCLAACCLLLLASLRTRPSMIVAGAATLGIFWGCLHLVRGPDAGRIHAPTAAICALFLGAGTSLLTHIARRARTNKGLD